MKKYLFALTALAAMTGSASAADLGARPYTKAPVAAAPVASWTGCYIGGGGGGGLLSQNTREFTLAGTPDSAVWATSGGRGRFGTVGGGCDYQFALGNWNMVVGALADYDFADIHGTRNASIGTWPYFGDEKLDQSWAVGARVGWLVTPTLLTYFSGGYTQAHFSGYNLTRNVFPIPTAPLFSVNSGWRDGWFIGSGLEYDLGWIPGLKWNTEYRFSDFKTVRDTYYAFGTTTPAGYTDSHKYVQTIRSTLVYQFNWGGPVVAKY